MKKDKVKIIVIFTGILILILTILFLLLQWIAVPNQPIKDQPVSVTEVTNPEQNELEQEELGEGTSGQEVPKEGESEIQQEVPEVTVEDNLREDADISKENKQVATYYESEIEGVTKTLNQFTNLIYNYDSSQRKYYEGTDQYMTKSGYERFVPGDSGEGTNEGTTEYESEPVVTSRLSLNQIEYFYNFHNSNEVKVIAKADITSSFINQNKSTQFLSLLLIKQEDSKWLISFCEVVDTINE